jgi:hypothetical protein
MNLSQESLNKFGKFFLKKAKTIKMEIAGRFGEGVVSITGIHNLSQYGGNIYIEINLKYTPNKAPQSSWYSQKKLGQIRNDKIRSSIEWDSKNDFYILGKAMGLRCLNVKNITVKKFVEKLDN